jgi:hypothetical protein
MILYTEKRYKRVEESVTKNKKIEAKERETLDEADLILGPNSN